jgi:zinc transport system permease protein
MKDKPTHGLHEHFHEKLDNLPVDSLYNTPNAVDDKASALYDHVHQGGHEPSWDEFWTFFDSFEPAILAGTLSGLLLGLMSVYVVSRHMVFLSAAVSQVAGLGLALGFLLASNFAVAASLSGTLGASFFTVLMVLITVTGRQASGPRRDSILGVAFLVGMAGTLVVGGYIPDELHDINALLFGSAVAVLPDELHYLVWMVVSLLFIHIWWVRGFMAVTLTREDAEVKGLPVRHLEGALWISLALAMAVTTQVLGALPTFAFSVVPAIGALAVARSMPIALLIAAIIGALGGLLGYMAAFFYHMPVGAGQALTTVALMLALLLIKTLLKPFFGRQASTKSR